MFEDALKQMSMNSRKVLGGYIFIELAHLYSCITTLKIVKNTEINKSPGGAGDDV